MLPAIFLSLRSERRGDWWCACKVTRSRVILLLCALSWAPLYARSKTIQSATENRAMTSETDLQAQIDLLQNRISELEGQNHARPILPIDCCLDALESDTRPHRTVDSLGHSQWHNLPLDRRRRW